MFRFPDLSLSFGPITWSQVLTIGFDMVASLYENVPVWRFVIDIAPGRAPAPGAPHNLPFAR